ncbi:MAG: GntR family transcriptional regulator [Spirochaetales bacterium]|uniref:GntR family transcriptional regulator n=1 Tax=Candidatus Thalassospirochaeta sargassi TaxID=3119039 RepID=A0AAJ1IKL3_9SPIO|nr:GntR family transcriptional regulator [Spirochaetales bacterium]
MGDDRILTITEQIVQKLRHDIYSEKLQPNLQLKETEVAERFGVSRGPVKQAFIQLTKEGLLEAKPNIGVRVAEKPNDDVHKLLKKMRRDIETFAGLHMAEILTDEDSLRLDNLLEWFRLACESGDIIKVRESDFELHEYIISRYEDSHLYDTWNFLILRMMMRYNRLSSLKDSYSEHKKIIDAIKSRDKDLIIKTVNQNIQ